MLTKIHGKIVFECDSCGDALDTETAEFAEAKDKLDAEGWKTFKTANDWSHKCPDCAMSPSMRDRRRRR